MPKYKDLFSQAEWNQEFGRLGNVTYLDHAGTALYSHSQLEDVWKDLRSHHYGNPHSRHDSSSLATKLIEDARTRILQFFGTSSDLYDVIFTSGATAALRLLSECFPWKDGAFVYTQESHTSVLGMREVAIKEGAQVFCIKCDDDPFTSNPKQNACSSSQNSPSYGLFVYPAMCNFSGYKFPLNWITKVHKGELNPNVLLQGAITDIKEGRCFWPSHWFCALDTAAFVSTNRLNLTETQPDFAFVSFYKLFGYPTGLGCLLVKKDLSCLMNKHYFGGGTVKAAIGYQRFRVPASELVQRLEDGTVAFLDIISLRQGLSRLVGNMSTISWIAFSLARYIHHSLSAYRHANGTRVAKLYSKTNYECIETQGGIVTFNLLRETGEIIGYSTVEKFASVYNIELRTGCFCNPGACQYYLQLDPETIKHHLQEGHVCGDDKDIIAGKATGAVRVSFGYSSRLQDAENFLKMIRECFVSGPLQIIEEDDWLDDWDLSKDSELCSVEIKNTERTKACENDLHAKRSQTTKMKESHCNGQISTNSPFLSRVEKERRLQSLYIYPVKSCAAMKVHNWSISDKGLLYDRMWMVVTSTGSCLTQKKEKGLCKIKPWIDLDFRRLLLRTEGVPVISIPLESNLLATAKASNLCNSKVCRDDVRGVDCGDEVGDWLCEVLGRPGLRLICQVQRNSAKNGKHYENQLLSFANEAQYLLLNRASIRSLQENITEKGIEVLDEEELIERFRPNLVIEGGAPYEEEHDHNEVLIGNTSFKVRGRCSRCQMICVNQRTGHRTKEPLLTLAQTQPSNMYFGINLCNNAGTESCLLKSGSPVIFQ